MIEPHPLTAQRSNRNARPVALRGRISAGPTDESSQTPNTADRATRIWVERRMGEILREEDLDPGGRPSENRSHDATSLSDLGIDKHASSRWQFVSAIPEAGVGGPGPVPVISYNVLCCR
jgi:hypothetical protein